MEPRKHSPTGADPDATQELTRPDSASKSGDHLSSTDTWAVPHFDTLGGKAKEAGVAAPAEPGAHLEGGLKSLSSSLRELTDELAAKSEHIADVEARLDAALKAGKTDTRARDGEILLTALRVQQAQQGGEPQALPGGGAQAAPGGGSQAVPAGGRPPAAAAPVAPAVIPAQSASGGAAAQRDAERKQAALRARLASMEARCAAQLEALQNLEARRGIFQAQLHALDQQILGRDRDLGEARALIEEHTRRADMLAAEAGRRDQRIGQLEGELAAATTALGERSGEAGSAERANAELRAQIAALSAQLAERTERVRLLEKELAASIREHEQGVLAHIAARRELTESGAVLRQRTDVLEKKLAEDRNQVATRSAALQKAEEQLAARDARLAAAERQVTELKAEVGMHTDSMRTLQQELQSRAQRGGSAETELRTAQESVGRLEGELRTRSARIDELTRANGELHAQVESAKHWLQERDSLMQRLESEAANSAVLVDSIQRSLKSLTPQGPQDEHAAGNRVLVRNEDGHEIIHVLGRRTSIGRTADNDVQIDADYISRHHALILSNSAQTIIEDLNSTNGVLVNGRRVMRQLLQDGDVVTVGKARFRFLVRKS